MLKELTTWGAACALNGAAETTDDILIVALSMPHVLPWERRLRLTLTRECEGETQIYVWEGCGKDLRAAQEEERLRPLSPGADWRPGPFESLGWLPCDPS